ncbi:lipopolysaccharide biosynthesis protein [Clavibacter michiganensis]|uniref:Teichuronic acid biosynthesis protein TuaB n=1 Tax=Clavibacter michiganensis TaxID=28447 RepID=A0A251YT30_9MICO|nr:lipopolysaccharide biosynthesis protein [Clavibacter michiganensis]OUE27396.1 Teichuronic acid biosynthesis protein TuaB [Clavibacter michiganensis]
MPPALPGDPSSAAAAAPAPAPETLPVATQGLGARAARGAIVTIGAQLIRILIQVASVVVLARLLTPTDYGLLAMVLAIIGVGEIFRDFGLSNAAIQARDLSRTQRDNLWWINAGIGLVLAALVFCAAWPLAAVFGHDELIPIAHALSLTFVFNGLATQYRASLTRSLRFRALATADVTAPAVALLVAIGGALLGWGYWALVAQQLTQTLVLLALAVGFARWIPRLPRRGEPMGPLLRFGWNMVSSQMVGYVSNNIDTFLVGLRFGAGSLGIYNRAFQLLMTPLAQIRSPLTTVAIPVLSRLADEQRRFADYVARGQLALGYTLGAGLGLVAASAVPITAVFLGPQWDSVAPILRLLAIAGIFDTLAFVGYWVYVSRGLTGDLFRFSLLSAVIKVSCILVGSSFGIVGIAAGYAAAPALCWPISLWWLSRKAPIPTRRLYMGALRIIGVVGSVSVATGALLAMVDTGSDVLQLLAGVGTTAVLYALAVALVPAVRRDVRGVLDLARVLPRARRGSAPAAPAAASAAASAADDATADEPVSADAQADGLRARS